MTSYWEKQPTDQPWTLNGFNGTWNFSDHALIPEALKNFIFEFYPKVERFKRIPLDEINKLMNDVWDGPGSMVKVEKIYHEMRNARLNQISGSSKDLGDVKTIDDYTESDFQNNPISSPSED